MAKNPIQFPKGLNLTAFLAQYGDESKCFTKLCLHSAGPRALHVRSADIRAIAKLHLESFFSAIIAILKHP